MTVNSQLNPGVSTEQGTKNFAVVKTEIDELFVQTYNSGMIPGLATALTPEIFKQASISNGAHIGSVLAGSGTWVKKAPGTPVAISNPRVINKMTTVPVVFADSIEIEYEFFRDNMHDTWGRMVEDFARGAQDARDRNAFQIYRGAYTTTLTADGAALIGPHTIGTGFVVDNHITNNPALSPSALNDAIVLLMQQKSQSGLFLNAMARYLLAPTALYKKALEITGSNLATAADLTQTNNTSGAVNNAGQTSSIAASTGTNIFATQSNALNIFNASHYGIKVFHSPFLGANSTNPDAGDGYTAGSDTFWFVIAANHSVTRYVRQGIETGLIDYLYNADNRYVYKGNFREEVSVIDYSGIVGSLGTGASYTNATTA